MVDGPEESNTCLKHEDQKETTLSGKISGDRNFQSNIEMNMLKDIDCAQLCEQKMTNKTDDTYDFILSDAYRLNLYLDELPAIGPIKFSDRISGNSTEDKDHLMRGFLLGHKTSEDHNVIYGHWDIKVMYHVVQNETDGKNRMSEIVSFEI